MENNITIYENFLPQEYFNKLSGIVTNQENMPWFFIDSVAEENDSDLNKDLQHGLAHLIYNEVPNSFLFDDFYPIIEIMQNDWNINVFNIKRIRLGMQIKLGHTSIINYSHIDYEQPHQVLLLYLNDADGDTFFYNEDKTILKTVSPKPNRAILFDGMILHNSSTPTKTSKRIALNINFNHID